MRRDDIALAGRCKAASLGRDIAMTSAKPPLPVRVLDFLGAHGTRVLAAGVFLGLAWPQLAAWAAPLLAPSVFVLLTAALIRLDAAALRRQAARPGAALLLILWLLVLSPALTAIIVGRLPLPPGIATAVVLMSAAPPIMSSIAFALMLGFDAALTTVATFLATLLAPVVLPPVALWLLGLSLDIDVTRFTLRLAVLAGGALVAALAIRAVVPRASLAANATRIDGIAVLTMLVFAVAIMSGVTATAVDRPGHVALVAAIAFVAALAQQAVALAVFWWRGRAAALAAAFCSGNRNLGLLLAALGAGAAGDVALYCAIGQLPIYILPWALRPLYRRLTDGST
jgi:BASS family bile acid:Na+ symporter